MKLEFDKTYNSVKFFKWEKFFSFDFWIDEFIADIKNENPKVIIERDLAKTLGIDFNFDKDEYEYEEE